MKQNNLTQMLVKIFFKKMSDNTGLQKNYILCTANLKKTNKKTNKPTDTTAAH